MSFHFGSSLSMRSFSRQFDKFKAFSLIKSLFDVVVVVDDVLEEEECDDEEDDDDEDDEDEDEELFSFMFNAFSLSCCKCCC